MEKTLLLHDNTGDPLERKVRRAVARYREKYGHAPTVVHVNPIDDEGIASIAGVRVVADAYVLPERLLLGVNGD